MSSVLDDGASSSLDLRHQTTDEGLDDAFYAEHDYEEGENDEQVGDSEIKPAGGDKISYAATLSKYSKASLFDLVYADKGSRREQEEQEEEEETRDGEDDSFSAVKYEQSRFRYVPLSEEEREAMVEKINDLFSEAKVSMVVNAFLHKHYIDINRKTPSMASALDKFDDSLVFEDTRYQRALDSFARARDQIDDRMASLTTELQNLGNTCSLAESSYAQNFEELLSQQMALAKRTKPPKYSKEAWLTEVEQLLENQRQRASEVAKIRLAHVHSQAKLAKLMARLRQFDSLGAGFSMMDYEYLLKRKGVYSERRDEQREHIKKLNDKNLTSAVIIRHIDEEADLYNEKVLRNLDHLNVLVHANKVERSIAVELAKNKVAISKSMTKLKEENGLLNYPFLLRKMERDLHQLDTLKQRSESLQAKMLADAKKIAECHS